MIFRKTKRVSFWFFYWLIRHTYFPPTPARCTLLLHSYLACDSGRVGHCKSKKQKKKKRKEKKGSPEYQSRFGMYRAFGWGFIHSHLLAIFIYIPDCGPGWAFGSFYFLFQFKDNNKTVRSPLSTEWLAFELVAGSFLLGNTHKIVFRLLVHTKHNSGLMTVRPLQGWNGTLRCFWIKRNILRQNLGICFHDPMIVAS